MARFADTPFKPMELLSRLQELEIACEARHPNLLALVVRRFASLGNDHARFVERVQFGGPFGLVDADGILGWNAPQLAELVHLPWMHLTWCPYGKGRKPEVRARVLDQNRPKSF